MFLLEWFLGDSLLHYYYNFITHFNHGFVIGQVWKFWEGCSCPIVFSLLICLCKMHGKSVTSTNQQFLLNFKNSILSFKNFKLRAAALQSIYNVTRHKSQTLRQLSSMLLHIENNRVMMTLAYYDQLVWTEPKGHNFLRTFIMGTGFLCTRSLLTGDVENLRTFSYLLLRQQEWSSPVTERILFDLTLTIPSYVYCVTSW